MVNVSINLMHLHLIVHDGVDEDSDAVLGQDLQEDESFGSSCGNAGWIYQNLLRGHIIGLGPHVDLLIVVDAGDDEEDSGAPCSAFEKSTKPEDNGSLIFLK